MQNSISEQARAAALAQLDAAEAAREDILVQHIANGVAINSRTVQIDPEVVIAPGAVILARRLRHRPQHPDRGQHRG